MIRPRPYPTRPSFLRRQRPVTRLRLVPHDETQRLEKKRRRTIALLVLALVGIAYGGFYAVVWAAGQ